MERGKRLSLDYFIT